MTSSQEMERVYSYNPRAHTGHIYGKTAEHLHRHREIQTHTLCFSLRLVSCPLDYLSPFIPKLQILSGQA